MKNQELDTHFAPSLCWISNHSFWCSGCNCVFYAWYFISIATTWDPVWYYFEMQFTCLRLCPGKMKSQHTAYRANTWIAHNLTIWYCINLGLFYVLLTLTNIRWNHSRPCYSLSLLSHTSASILCGSITNSGGCKSKDLLSSMSLDFVMTEDTHTLIDLDHPRV